MEDSAAEPGVWTFHGTRRFLISAKVVETLLKIIHSMLLYSQLHGGINEVQKTAQGLPW